MSERDVDVDAELRAKAGWLWTGASRCCRGLLRGRSAWQQVGRRRTGRGVDSRQPAQSAGIQTHGDRIEDDEIELDGRCAGHLAGQDGAGPRLLVPNHDRCARRSTPWRRATEIKAADVELLARRYAGRRGIARAREQSICSIRVRSRRKSHGYALVLIQDGPADDRRPRFRSLERIRRVQSHIWTWAGRTSKSRLSTTASITAAIADGSPGISGDWRACSDAGGS